jgi:SAM domain (Sterile alpha motif)
MAAASLDVNFKEELSAIEQCKFILSSSPVIQPLITCDFPGFKVLSEAERTAALYSLLQHSTQVQIRFFITVLQQMARADPMTALLSPAVGGSMQSQMEAKLANMSLKSPGLKSTMPSSPSTRNFGSSANSNRQSLVFDSSSSFLSPDTTNGVSNSSDAAATLAQQRAKLKASNAAHRISAPALASSTGERTTWAAASSLGQVAERDNSPTQEITIEPKSSRPQSTDFSGIASNPAFRSPRPDGTSATGSNNLDTLSPVVGDSWASMVNTPLMHMFPKPSAVANNGGPGPTQTVDLSTKLTDLYGTGTVPRLDGPEKFRRASKGHTPDSGNNSPTVPSTATNSHSNNNNNSIYGDDGDPIQGQGQGGGRVQGASTRGLRNGGGGTWSGAQSPALSNTSGRFGGSDDGSTAMAAAAQQQAALAGLGMGVGSFNLGLGSPALAGMPNGLSVAQLAQLNGMNPFGVNMNMLNMMGITAEAQLLAAQIAAAGGGFGQPGLGVNPGLGTFAGLQGGIGAGQRSGPGRSGGRSPGAGSSKSTTGNGAKKDEDDFDPAVLSDVAGWLRTLRLHKYTPNFEGMTWKEMVVMDEAALEAQGVAALGARRKMLKTFDMVRKKMGIDDPTVPPPPGAPTVSAPTPTSAGSTGTLI